MKFYSCSECKSIFTFIKEPQDHLQCCNQPLKELIPGTSDASKEKHVPVVTQVGQQVTVKVGSLPHPMIPEHYIEWIILETSHGYQLKNLTPNDAPEAEFILSKNETIKNCYAYCNIHYLWKS
ncbi:MAG: hypothetical protein K2P14_02340 [Anaeroplasmataceae bacterium]|jgi:desulfoferrodoxin ferrous iron-binding domain|nr:hypothetical protein [Anaeroplasmataceae bacterium]HRF70974.1 desulfoferrodoxin family protein [Candidatus Pelethenecus sp.]